MPDAKFITGLGSAARKDVGTVAGTVAAADDGRIVGAGSAVTRLGLDSSVAFNVLSTGQSQTVGVGEGGDLTIEANIQVWNDVLGVYQTAVYGTYPLNMKTPSGAQSTNPGVATCNEARRSGRLPADRPIRLHLVAMGGKSIANWVAWKTNGNGVAQGPTGMALIDAVMAAARVTQIHMIEGVQGEADCITTTADAAQVGGAFPAWGFGNNGSNLVAGTDFPQSVVDAIVAAGGFNTQAGYKAARDAWHAALRRRSWCPPGTPMVFAELHAYFGAVPPVRNDLFASLSSGADPYIGIAATAGLKGSIEAGNANHWDGPSLNIVGRRLWQKYLELALGSSSAGVNDLYGNKVASRFYLSLLGNTDQYAVSNSTDGATYTVSIDQVRNGCAVRVASAAGSVSKIILPNGANILGAVDLEAYVWSVSNGSTYLLSLQPIYDMPLQPTRVVLGGSSYYQYEINNISHWRFTSAFGAWRFLANPRPLGLQRSTNFGLSTIGTNAYTLDLSAAPVTDNVLTLSYTLAGTTNVVTAPFDVTADGTLADLAANLQASLLTVAAGWVVNPIGSQNAVCISGPSGQVLTFNAGASLTTGGASQPTWNWRPNVYALATWQAGMALSCVGGVTYVLPSANASTPGIFYLIPAAESYLDCWSNAQIIDSYGVSNLGTNGAVPPITMAANVGFEVQALANARWHLSGGIAITQPATLRQGGTLGINPFRVVLSGSSLVTGNTLSLTGTITPSGGSATAFAAVSQVYAASSTATLVQAAAALQAALSAVVPGVTCRVPAPQNVIQIDSPAGTALAIAGSVTGGAAQATVSQDAGIYNLTVQQTRGWSYTGTSGLIYNLPNPNSANGRCSIAAPSGGSIQMGAASGFLVNRAGGTVTGTNYLTIPKGMTAVWESSVSNNWTPTSGSYLSAAGTRYFNAASTMADASGYQTLSVFLNNNGSTLSSFAVPLPVNPADGDTHVLSTQVAVTSVTYSGGTVLNAATSLAANSTQLLRFSNASGFGPKWARVV